MLIDCVTLNRKVNKNLTAIKKKLNFFSDDL